MFERILAFLKELPAGGSMRNARARMTRASRPPR